MDARHVPADTCPLCRQRSLTWSGTTCTCRSCGSAFDLNPDTRRCRYVRVAPAYAAAAPALTADWLTRQEVFERVDAVLPASTSSTATSTATSTVTSTATLTPAPIKVVWAVLVGALALIPILCACLSALLLSPGIANTRRMIAVANAPTATATETLIPITVTELASPIGALESPIQTPELAPTQPDMTATSGVPGDQMPTLPPMITVEILTPTSQPTPMPPITTRRVALPTSQSPVPQATATLPATFTPAAVPATVQPVSPIATPVISPTSQAAGTAIATVEVTVTSATVPTFTSAAAPVVAATPQITSGVVISTVMYMGNPSINQADQYVEIYNHGPVAVNVTEWKIRAVNADKTTYLNNGLVMQPGQACRIYTNSPTNYGECGAMSYYSPVPVWSQSGDTAELIDANGVIVSVFRYP